MRFLVLGCRGMLGSDLMKALNPGADLIGLDLEEIDITDAARCRAVHREVRPEVTISAAALTVVDYCESHPEEAFRVNAQGAGNVAAAAAAVGALVVHYSTDYVFDGKKKEPYLEDDPPNPVSVYGRSKLRGEEMVRSTGAAHLIVRTSWLFGLRGRNFIRTILNAARAGKPLHVVCDQLGSPTYSKDLAAATARMVAAGCRGTYHVTNSGSCSWYELARCAMEWAGIPEVQVQPVSSSQYVLPAPRPEYSVLANARLESEGLPRLRPWQEAAQDYIQQL